MESVGTQLCVSCIGGKQDLKDLLDPEFSINTISRININDKNSEDSPFWLIASDLLFVSCHDIAPCYAISELLFGISECFTM